MSWLSCCSSSLCKSDDKSGLHAPEKIPATDEPPKSARSTRGSPSKLKAKRPSPLAKKADKGKQDGEEIDKELTASVKTFNESLTSPLKVRRWGDGEYEIDGKRVKLCFVPSNGDQKELIVQEGGKIVGGRVGADLAISRSLGDHRLKGKGVSCKPDICSFNVAEGHVLIVATDGLWDVVSDEEACEIVESCVKRAEEMDASQQDVLAWLRDNTAQALVDKAMRLGTQDNILALVVFF